MSSVRFAEELLESLFLFLFLTCDSAKNKLDKITLMFLLIWGNYSTNAKQLPSKQLSMFLFKPL